MYSKLNILNYIINFFGARAYRQVSEEKILNLIKCFRPMKTQFDLKRIGDKNDGGYLIPDIINEIKYCVSGGVGHTNEFEFQLEKLNIKSFLADYSVDAPKDLNNFDFKKKFLASFDNPEKININSWIKSFGDKCNLEQSILKLDIEKSEYEVINTINEEVLKKFKILIIEFHGIEMIGEEGFYQNLSAVKNKILKYFLTVHIHPNNCCGMHNVRKFKVPSVLEVTYLNKSLAKKSNELCILPHELDAKNKIKYKDIFLPDYWIS
tara:strand:- start:295 stop:1089 length:795 start_codon:yes stop_codon:yes gene_type:complete